MGQSALLNPGLGFVIVPPTSPAVEPDLTGRIYRKLYAPFTIMNAAGGVECAGELENVAVLSGAHHYNFYYFIRGVSNVGAVNRIRTFDFSRQTVRVGYRQDWSGTVPPFRADRFFVGDWVTFSFPQPISCKTYGKSPFMVIKTLTDNLSLGKAVITSTAGYSAQVTTLGPGP